MKTSVASPSSARLRTVVVGGFSSKVGKTTLICELLRAFPGWEAIKVTRGHRHPHAANARMSGSGDPRRDESVICSGRDQNYLQEKDTGRFWDAGATNVHWVIAIDSQVEQGVKRALERVRGPGVIFEGNSVLRFMELDFAIMVARPEGGEVKPTARLGLQRADALYLAGDMDGDAARERFALWRGKPGNRALNLDLPIYCRDDLSRLIECVRKRVRE